MDQFTYHLLRDAACLTHQLLRQLTDTILVEREVEIPAAVPPVRERAVVVAEDGFVPDAPGLLLHIYVAVAHSLHSEDTLEGFCLHILAALKVDRAQPCFQHADGQQAIQRYLTLNRIL